MPSRLLKLVTLFCLCGLVGYAQAQLPKWDARIEVRVSAAPKDLQELIESYITRELRALGDVAVVQDKPGWILSIVAVTSESNAPIPVLRGYALSIVLLQPIKPDVLKIYAQKKLSEEKMNGLVSTYATDTYRYLHHSIDISPASDLQTRCKEIVAMIDTKFFQPERLGRQKLMDTIDKK